MERPHLALLLDVCARWLATGKAARLSTQDQRHADTLDLVRTGLLERRDTYTVRPTQQGLAVAAHALSKAAEDFGEYPPEPADSATGDGAVARGYPFVSFDYGSPLTPRRALDPVEGMPDWYWVTGPCWVGCAPDSKTAPVRVPAGKRARIKLLDEPASETVVRWSVVFRQGPPSRRRPVPAEAAAT
jgi:hypothetical protein